MRAPDKGSESLTGVEIILKPAYFKFNYLYIPAAETKYFPLGSPKTSLPIRVVTETVSYAAELQYNSVAHV
jgi:hypothetical protein